MLNGAFQHFYLPTAHNGWIRGDRGELLLWVPEKHRQFMQHPPCELVMTEDRCVVDWEDAAVGTEWTRCYRTR